MFFGRQYVLFYVAVAPHVAAHAGSDSLPRVGDTTDSNPEPEFLNIYLRLESRLSAKSCLFKGQRVQQGSCRLEFLFADRKGNSV